MVGRVEARYRPLISRVKSRILAELLASSGPAELVTNLLPPSAAFCLFCLRHPLQSLSWHSSILRDPCGRLICWLSMAGRPTRDPRPTAPAAAAPNRRSRQCLTRYASSRGVLCVSTVSCHHVLITHHCNRIARRRRRDTHRMGEQNVTVALAAIDFILAVLPGDSQQAPSTRSQPQHESQACCPPPRPIAKRQLLLAGGRGRLDVHIDGVDEADGRIVFRGVPDDLPRVDDAPEPVVVPRNPCGRSEISGCAGAAGTHRNCAERTPAGKMATAAAATAAGRRKRVAAAHRRIFGRARRAGRKCPRSRCS